MKIRPFYIAPVLPDELKHLRDIAMNLWYSWNWDAVQLFMRMDEKLWDEVYQNPVAMLGRVPQARFKELAQDEGFVANVERIHNEQQNYIGVPKWYQHTYRDRNDLQVAYFSAEFGLAEALPVYSGGLGVLSGDHLKSSSDMGIPLVGIGLLYRQGYFRQRLNPDGWQVEEYPENDWYNMSVTLETKPDGEPLLISVEMGDLTVFAHIWRVQVGNTRLFLLDTNFAQNPSKAREITTQLYGGDRDMRLRQELLLGIGGVRALKALNIQPTVYHLNEGHSAFLILERIRDLMTTEGLSFQESRELVRATNVFTTHTPVPAGNEQFDAELLRRYLERWIDSHLKLGWEDFLRMGRVDPNRQDEQFGMTVFALRNAAHCNGVSRLHGEVSRKMWKSIWPTVPIKEIPILHVTNGIHTKSWLSHDLCGLIEHYAGNRFCDKPWEYDTWDLVEKIPDNELWRVHQIRRERLIHFARKRLKQQLRRRHAQMMEIAQVDDLLNPHALTIGFSRRVATYKRANLLFADLERLKKIICNPQRPVQFIFAGKAHPHDMPAKEIIKNIFSIIHEEPFREHFIFLEDYDINVARYLVQGVDIWLNNPRRPLEASGTSGMKAAINGGLNLSVLDGWWDEAFSSDVGWAIVSEEEAEAIYQDKVESEALYNLLEHNVIPLYYNRDATGVPWEWIKKMKNSIRKLGRFFNTHRMLQEYTETFYLPANELGHALSTNQYEQSKRLNNWQEKIRQAWNRVKIEKVDVSASRQNLRVGDNLSLRVQALLADLKPSDVCVEVLFGSLDSQGELEDSLIFPTQYAGKGSDGQHIFSLDIPCGESGQHGFSVRIRPQHPDLARSFSYEFLQWG